MTGELITILLDGLNGIDVRQCSRVSRYLNRMAEEDEELGNYQIEVTSCGIGYNIANERQLKSNVGRLVRLHLSQDQEVVGRLAGFGQEMVFLKEDKNMLVVAESEIEKATVEIEF